jgi:hypothetical protein
LMHFVNLKNPRVLVSAHVTQKTPTNCDRYVRTYRRIDLPDLMFSSGGSVLAAATTEKHKES